MRVVMQAVRSREPVVDYVRQHVPQLEVIWDDGDGAWATWQRSLAIGGDDPHVHLEDDVTLTVGFLEKVNDLTDNGQVQHLIQLFNRSKHTRRRPGSSFTYTCGFYLPARWGTALGRYCASWSRPMHKRGVVKNQYDYMLADWMQMQKLSYGVAHPPLVQHTPLPSTLSHGGVRTSPHFVEPELRGHPYPELIEEATVA